MLPAALGRIPPPLLLLPGKAVRAEESRAGPAIRPRDPLRFRDPLRPRDPPGPRDPPPPRSRFAPNAAPFPPPRGKFAAGPPRDAADWSEPPSDKVMDKSFSLSKSEGGWGRSQGHRGIRFDPGSGSWKSLPL